MKTILVVDSDQKRLAMAKEVYDKIPQLHFMYFSNSEEAEKSLFRNAYGVIINQRLRYNENNIFKIALEDGREEDSVTISGLLYSKEEFSGVNGDYLFHKAISLGKMVIMITERQGFMGVVYSSNYDEKGFNAAKSISKNFSSGDYWSLLRKISENPTPEDLFQLLIYTKDGGAKYDWMTNENILHDSLECWEVALQKLLDQYQTDLKTIVKFSGV